jgi:crotonobetainyl-CoA:carnitine CoA-transferase CaiB-like acyl-CoA transferase
MPDENNGVPRALAGIRVIDASNLIAAPLATTFLADFGADVIKLEHPQGGDAMRTHGRLKDGEPLWWKYLGRNKRCITLYLGHPRGQEIFRQLARDADVVVENYRPGTMEKWGLGYEALCELNPRLVMARVTGFGQQGPWAGRTAFGSLAEAMSGFAHRNGYPEQPPVLPPFGVADNVTGIITAFAIMTALWARQVTGMGQQIDLAMIESLLPILEPQILEYDQLGTVMQRIGNGSTMNAPRNTYRTMDDRYVAISSSTHSTAERTVLLAGRADIVEEPWFSTAHGRAAHAAEIDAAVGAWVGSLTLDDVVRACEEAGAPVGVIQSVDEVVAHPQYQALGSVLSVDDPTLGPIRMPNVQFRLSRTPGEVRWPGPSLGQHNTEVYAALGLTANDLADLRQQGVV